MTPHASHAYARRMSDAVMLKFVGTGQEFPAKRTADLRAEDFREIADRYAVPDAETQAGRCSQCGVPYCSVHCPLCLLYTSPSPRD